MIPRSLSESPNHVFASCYYVWAIVGVKFCSLLINVFFKKVLLLFLPEEMGIFIL